MINPSSSSVLDMVLANNAKAKKDTGIASHKNFQMAHPQKLTTQRLASLLGKFDLSNPDRQSNGMIRGNTLDGGTFKLTPGVIKFNQGNVTVPPQPPAYPQQNGDAAPAYPLNAYA